MADAEVFYDPDGGYSIRLTLGLEFSEELLSILAGYGEYAGDKLETMADYPDEYTSEDIARLRQLKESAAVAYRLLVNVYSEAVATVVYGPDEEATEDAT